jgi:hypothetical protein
MEQLVASLEGDRPAPSETGQDHQRKVGEGQCDQDQRDEEGAGRRPVGVALQGDDSEHCAGEDAAKPSQRRRAPHGHHGGARSNHRCRQVQRPAVVGEGRRHQGGDGGDQRGPGGEPDNPIEEAEGVGHGEDPADRQRGIDRRHACRRHPPAKGVGHRGEDRRPVEDKAETRPRTSAVGHARHAGHQRRGDGEGRAADKGKGPMRTHSGYFRPAGVPAFSAAASTRVSARMSSRDRVGCHPVRRRTLEVSGTRRRMSSNPTS